MKCSLICSKEKYLIIMTKCSCCDSGLISLFEICTENSLHSIFEYSENTSCHNHDILGIVATFIDKHLIDLSFTIVFFTSPNLRWFFKNIIEIPQPNSVIAHRTNFIISLIQNHIFIFLSFKSL